MLAPGIQVRKRIIFLLLAFVIGGAGLSGRLAYWQIYRGGELAGEAFETRAFQIPIKAPRGEIRDRHNRLMAGNKSAESVFAVPREICAQGQNKDLPADLCAQRKAAVARTLADVLKLDEQKVLGRLNRKSSYEYIKRKIAPEQAQIIKSLIKQGQLPGVGLEPETERYYPEGTLAAHALGFAGIDNQGLGGLEVYYDEYLRGKNGAIAIERDALGKQIVGGERQIVPPQPGMTLVSTIDLGIQQIVERGLEQVVTEYQALQAAIIVMDVKTGEILALGQYPTYDPNRFAEYDQRLWRNWIVADAYHPGSIFKPVTASAALEEGLLRPESPWSDPGCITLPGWGRPFCNWNSKGFSGTFKDVVANSSNTGFATIGMNLGADRFYKYLDLFNLDKKTGIDIPGEGRGIIVPKTKVTKLDLAMQGVGQTLTVSPLAMLAAVNAVANDGVWVQPHLMKELRAPGGQSVIRHDTVRRQVVSQKTARELQAMLEAVVSEGTGRAAQVPGYKVAGKTGTAEKNQGIFAGGQKTYIASFAGFAPVPNPQVSVLISVHEPKGFYYGGQVAAPVFGQMMGDILRYLEIPPAAPVEVKNVSAASDAAAEPRKVTVPEFTNLPVADARALALQTGLVLELGGAGPLVTAQEPAAGTEVLPGSVITALAEPPAAAMAAAGQTVPVPLLSGLTLRQAAELLAQSGLDLRFSGSGAVTRQEPAPGDLVPRGSRVRVWLEPPVSARGDTSS